MLQSGGVMKVIAATEEESNKNGSGSHSAFGHPIGVFVPREPAYS